MSRPQTYAEWQDVLALRQRRVTEFVQEIRRLESELAGYKEELIHAERAEREAREIVEGWE